MKSQIVTFLIQCPDQKGLVAKITNFFFEKGDFPVPENIKNMERMTVVKKIECFTLDLLRFKNHTM